MFKKLDFVLNFLSQLENVQKAVHWFWTYGMLQVFKYCSISCG